MSLTDFHNTFAYLSAMTMALVCGEGALRAFQKRAPGEWAKTMVIGLLILIGITALAGLVLLVTGQHPHEWMHLLYAVVAFSIVPITDTYARHWDSRGRALTRFGSGLVGLVVLFRLFGTG